MDLLNHIEFPVSDGELLKAFYEEALAPLGIHVVISVDPVHTKHGGTRYGFGRGGYPSLWIHERKGQRAAIHVAFTADSRAAVDAFYAAAMKSGGRDNGPPGIREHYHSSYYAAYVLDPDGNNIEAVCQI
jgi:catechol 2,3-dioxygenase-like lactoylglutathione lyase family enzyme